MSFTKLLLFVGFFLFFEIMSIPSYGNSEFPYVEGEVLVKYKNGTPEVKRHNMQGKMGSGIGLEGAYETLNVYHYKTNNGASYTTEQLVDIFKKDPEVEIVEPNYIITVDDPDFIMPPTRVTSLTEEELEYKNETVNTMKILDGWNEIGYTTEQTVVAVLDTGIQINHESLKDFLWINDREIENGIDDDKNGFIDDVYGWNFVDGNNNLDDISGHGTGVAGVIKQTFGDLLTDDVSDRVTNISIMPIKFMTLDPLINKSVGNTADALAAMDYANKNGASVINASWGDYSKSIFLEEIIYESYKKNIAFVSAAGNSSRFGNNNDITPYYPSNFKVPNVISVGASALDDVLTRSSNYGSKTVHLAAPGHSVWTTTSDESDVSYYVQTSGTSISTPFVAGAAAILMNLRPDLPVHQIKDILLNSSDRVTPLENKIQNARRLNMLNSVIDVYNAKRDTRPNTYEFSSLSEDPNSSGCGLISSNTIGGNNQTNVSIFLSFFMLAIPFILCLRLRLGLNFSS